MSTLLTPEQVAEMLGVSRRTVHRMAADGELPALASFFPQQNPSGN